jgi:hypothetical protein
MIHISIIQPQINYDNGQFMLIKGFLNDNHLAIPYIVFYHFSVRKVQSKTELSLDLIVQ